MPQLRSENPTPGGLDGLLAAGDKVPADKVAESKEAELKLQLQAHNERDKRQTVLGGVFDGIYRGDDQSKAALNELSQELKAARTSGDKDLYQRTAERVDKAVQADKDSLWTADTVTGVGSSAVKVGGLFMAIAATKGRALMASGAATFALYGLDQAHSQDSFSQQLTDFGLGGTKGLAMTAAFKALGKLEVNPVLRGVTYGTSGRLIDLGLSRQTYENPASNGQFDLGHGLKTTLEGTFASRAMVTDAVLFGVSSKLSGGLDKLVGPQLNSSLVYKTMSTSSMFGLSSGMHAEFVRQEAMGEKFDLSKLMIRGLAQATADGLAGVPAGRYSAGIAARESVRQAPETQGEPSQLSALVKPEVVAAKPEVNAAKPEGTVSSGGQRNVVASESILPDGSRFILKNDGTKVTLHLNGDKVIDKPGEPLVTVKPDGRVLRQTADGKITETRSKENTPLDERPLNVASGAYEGIGKLMSNFASRPFTLDGRRYESVEGFYQGLKWSDPAQRVEIAKLSGAEAKSAGRGSKAKSFEYDGTTIEFRSAEHYALMKRAIKASLEQNPQVMQEFLQTYPRPIEHKTGRRDNPNSGYPNSVFVSTLAEVRAELLPKAIAPLEVKPDAAAVTSTEGAMKVSELIKSIKTPEAIANHNLDLYAKALADFGTKGSSVVATGSDAVVLKLQDGNILKVGSRANTREPESFDMPVLKSGTLEAEGRTVRYVVQPEAQPAKASDLGTFLATISGKGFRMTDPGISQIGLYEGQVKLLDPFAVTRN